MKLKDIFTDCNTALFVVTDNSHDNELEWTIEPTSLELIPNDENNYYVRGKQVSETSVTGCFIGIETPYRIAESVLKLTTNGEVIVESIVYQRDSIIPVIAAECTGDYQLFYSFEDPKIGLEILTTGLAKATNKIAPAEDLGYIFKDEERLEEAIEAFKICEEAGSDNVFIYKELSEIYKQLGQADQQLYYQNKFIEGGGM
jgi:tetratricopeptide (TPR) repeat protein